MALLEARMLLPEHGLGPWTDALLEAGAASVAVEDDAGDTPEEVALYGEPGMLPETPAWKRNRVTILFDDAQALPALLARAAAAMGGTPPDVLDVRAVAEQDWVRQTQAQFPPIAIGRMWVVPSWHEPPDPAAINLRLDPGVAFGTGSHPTTHLCLQWLERHLAAGASVLDFGCGSGILAIGAALLGAGAVAGVDIDPQAVAAARDNAVRNGVRLQADLPDALARQPDLRFDLVVANILARPLLLLAPTLVARLRPGGTVLLSGILERQAEEVMGAYRQCDPGLRLGIAGREDGWVAIAGVRSEE